MFPVDFSEGYKFPIEAEMGGTGWCRGLFGEVGPGSFGLVGGAQGGGRESVGSLCKKAALGTENRRFHFDFDQNQERSVIKDENYSFY